MDGRYCCQQGCRGPGIGRQPAPPGGPMSVDDGVMVWALLVFLGVPLWLCAAGIVALVYRNRQLRHRPGNVPVRRHIPGKGRWSRGHGVWVGDVFAFRGSRAAWQETLLAAAKVSRRPLTDQDKSTLRRLDAPVLVSIINDDGVS